MFDSHAHPTDARFDKDRIEVIDRARKSGVTEIMCVLSTPGELEIFREELASLQGLWGSVGIHPHDASRYDELEEMLSAVSQEEKILAVGEIGLDYHYMNSPSGAQREVFRKQLRLAKKLNVPVIIHSREAREETWEILKEEDIHQGVMHCFSGGEELLEKYLALGLYISLAGPVTFLRASHLRYIVSLIPLNRLLVETDCPYLSPQDRRGQRNEPAFLKFILRKLSSLHQVSFAEIERITQNNARELFELD